MTGATAICKFFNEFFDYKINKNNMLTAKPRNDRHYRGLAKIYFCNHQTASKGRKVMAQGCGEASS